MVPASENVADGWLLATPHEPPVLNNSMRVMVFVFAATRNCSVASNPVFVSHSRQVKGAESGVFDRTLPFIVHFMAVGATIVCKSVVPVVQASGQASEELKALGGDVSGRAAREIENLIVKAIRK